MDANAHDVPFFFIFQVVIVVVVVVMMMEIKVRLITTVSVC